LKIGALALRQIHPKAAGKVDEPYGFEYSAKPRFPTAPLMAALLWSGGRSLTEYMATFSVLRTAWFNGNCLYFILCISLKESYYEFKTCS
jgi:hypothetical protein